MTSYRQSMKDTLELMNLMREAKLLERDLTPDEEKRREEIAKDLPDDDFKKRYGDQWMQVKMATATNMVKKEELDLDERMRMPRQLIDKNKEVMLVKKNKVIVVDKKDQDKYMKQGWTLAEEFDLEEGKMKDLVTKGQDLETYAKKSGGIDKNDMMKVAAMLKKGNKSGAVKYAMGLDTDPKEYILNLIGEEVGLNEDNLDLMRKASKGSAQTLKMKDGNLKMDSFTASAIMQIYDKINDKNKKTFENMMKNGKKADILKLQKFAMSKINSEYVPEELELDEGKMGDQWQKGAKSVKSGPFELMRGKSGVHAIMQNGKKLGDFSYDDEADNFVANMKGMKGQWVGNDIDSLINHLQKVHKEELELDEKVEYVEYKFRNKNDAMKAKAMLDAVQLMSFDVEDDDISNGELRVDAGNKDMTKYHKEIMKKFRPKVMTQEKVEIEEASAAADARRAMRRDPEMKQRAFSKDDSATDDDKKAASKNIMMQMRKAQSLNGKFDVEFQDGKKVKIPAKMAIAVQQKYNSMRKPSDKEKFQAKVGKSYRDMLNALKEAVSPAQQAAIAISKKERGEKPKKESILDRIDRKIKENKNG